MLIHPSLSGLSNSKPEVKDSAKEEMTLREGFERKNRLMNKHISTNDPILAVPDRKLEILDMMPRVDIIEDQFFRKSIPKSTKLYKFRRNFNSEAEGSDPASSTKFMTAIVRDAQHEAIQRDIRYRKCKQTDPKYAFLDAKKSESTKVNKNACNNQSREKIFGEKQVLFPEGTPLI